jgi:zinc transporter ZupT
MGGFAIGAAFQAGITVAVVVAIAVISHGFADGFTTCTITSLYGKNRRPALTLPACDAVPPVTGAAAGQRPWVIPGRQAARVPLRPGQALP